MIKPIALWTLIWLHYGLVCLQKHRIRFSFRLRKVIPHFALNIHHDAPSPGLKMIGIVGAVSRSVSQRRQINMTVV